jgi:hypothetical protein
VPELHLRTAQDRSKAHHASFAEAVLYQNEKFTDSNYGFDSSAPIMSDTQDGGEAHCTYPAATIIST